jgi:acyl-coenzyme A thioesterase PaaI-like protein
VLRQGRSLVYLDIEATTPSGKLVAKGQATYKMG